ncbi:hypothetical protein [Staphylococcus delphini]|uniref:Phage protein n=1 Tax=Staphylococcus delphini TaxID=53344 RepID=A0AAX0QTC8_9STAP|nr:hypothetical protein [Staphylococcus delphini]PCF50087.1 hypothetical protein B5C07_07725 [Staphylococcus delphini]PNZ95708.1 hypothetical protein CD148_03265 [Staphylococcus delphini]RIZ56281.1 hypothetical protein CDL68_01700 [Staphylococcus delphini]VED62515.1 Uncharacterised protein [Staphylococcus delphini]
MERLLVKYADKVVEFEEKLRNKYKSDSIKLEVRSSVSWLGEELRVESEQGDYLTLFDDENGELSIDYYFVPTEEAESFTIEVKGTYVFREEWKLDIIKSSEGKYTYKKWYRKVPAFDTIDSLIKHVDEDDPTSRVHISDGKESREYDYKILEER